MFNIVKYYNKKKSILTHFKIELINVTSKSSVSHDPSEIIVISWFCAQETFLIIIVKNSCAA